MEENQLFQKVLKAGFALAFTQGLPWLIHPGALTGEYESMIFQYLFLITFGLQVGKITASELANLLSKLNPLTTLQHLALVGGKN